MSGSEGVIKFDLDVRPGPAPPAGWLRELDAWRELFRRLGLLGQDPRRYDGFGFGNLSRRRPDADDHSFVISATQTGGLPRLTPADYVLVETCDPARNRVRATGMSRPSSEALSHAVVYQTCAAIDWVMHLHSPDIFRAGARLGLPGTDPAAAYGSVAMAAEIRGLVSQTLPDKPLLLVMTGHQDGILACGGDADTVGALVVTTLAQALCEAAAS
ncbi:MAG: class II aldolase/adducin family protein [Desulfuromonadales bacterium]|nr:class II aldolase/adducin family protein [Desulfuromonadales bacterium]